MRTATILTALFLTAGLAQAFPPAPHHELYGVVRDEQGNPLPGDASVTLVGTSGEILTSRVDPGIAPGVNYSLKVSMDAGTLAQLYQNSAMRPLMPFTVKVVIGGVEHVPIEVQGGMLQMGEPGGRTRLDLTLGVDSDSDGLPDAWEQDVIGAIDGLDDLSDVDPDGDSDHDGVSNYIEYLAGTYAFDRRASFRIDVVEVKDGQTHLRFLAIKGRSYRLEAGLNGGDFASVTFSLQADGSAQAAVHRADSIRFQDIYVPAVGSGAKQLFRLHVE